MHRVFLLGVPVDPVTRVEALTALRQFLKEEFQHHVMTPNSEMLVAAVRNPAFHDVLCKSALNIPDSVGLLHMARLTGQNLPERVTGVDTVMALCATLDDQHPVFLLGAGKGVAERAAKELQTRNPHLKIAGTFAGSPLDADAPAIIERINASGAHLLLVAYGAPAQDLWIARHLNQLKTVRVAMGVGGTFDFLAGNIRRAPTVFRRLGVEWLWRLMKQPRRIGRILNAVIVFPLMVLRFGRRKPGNQETRKPRN